MKAPFFRSARSIKKYSMGAVLVALAVVLTTLSLISTPTVDKILLENNQGYPFFYAITLPIEYYVSIIYLVLLTIVSKGKSTRLLSLLLLGLLIEFTPSVLLVNPWVADQYPFLSEPVWLIKYHYIGDCHLLAETPGLGLEFSQLMLVTGLDPFMISEGYPLFAILGLLLIILTARELGKNEVLAGLLFLSFNFFYQMNIVHRQSFSYLLFLLSIFLLVRLISKRRVEYSIAYMLSFLIMVVSHPGTSAFMAISLMVASAGLYILRKKRELLAITLVSVLTFFSYYMYVNTLDLSRMAHFIQNAISEFFTEPTSPAGAGYLASYVEPFQTIILTRFYITLSYLMIASMFALWVILRRREQTSLLLVSLVHLGLALQLSVFLYQFGLSGRPLMFLICTSALLISSLSMPNPKRAELKALKGIGLCLIILLLLFLPVLRYSGIPYLHPPSEELKAKIFLDSYYTYSEPIYATEKNLAYGLSLLIEGNLSKGEPIIIYEPESLPELDRNYLTLSRFVTRDGYWRYTMGYKDYVETLLRSLQTSHNLVYSNSEYCKIFVVTEKLEKA